MDRETPGHLIRRETGREKLEVKALEKVIKYEEKIKREKDRSIIKKCWKWMKRNTKGKNEEEKRERLMKLGWNKSKYERQLE